MAGATHVGSVRAENQDWYGTWGPDVGDWDGLIAVADGVGGHLFGRQAAEVALAALVESLTAHMLPASGPSVGDRVEEAMRSANAAVCSAFSDTVSPRPGSTLTCVLVKEAVCYVGHVGDSRAYMIRGGHIFQLSCDHTWVQLQVEGGTMTAEEAARSPYRNQVVKALGAHQHLDPDIVVRSVTAGDLLVVCSDGVSEHVSAQQLLQQALDARSIEEFVQSVVMLAVSRGGSDNATAVAAGVPLADCSGDRCERERPITTELPVVE